MNRGNYAFVHQKHCRAISADICHKTNDTGCWSIPQTCHSELLHLCLGIRRIECNLQKKTLDLYVRAKVLKEYCLSWQAWSCHSFCSFNFIQNGVLTSIQNWYSQEYRKSEVKVLVPPCVSNMLLLNYRYKYIPFTMYVFVVAKHTKMDDPLKNVIVFIEIAKNIEFLTKQFGDCLSEFNLSSAVSEQDHHHDKRGQLDYLRNAPNVASKCSVTAKTNGLHSGLYIFMINSFTGHLSCVVT